MIRNTIAIQFSNSRIVVPEEKQLWSAWAFYMPKHNKHVVSIRSVVLNKKKYVSISLDFYLFIFN